MGRGFRREGRHCEDNEEKWIETPIREDKRIIENNKNKRRSEVGGGGNDTQKKKKEREEIDNTP